MTARIAFGVAFLISVPASAQWKAPPTRTVDATDTYFGKTYKDPFRWLENLADAEVQAWFKSQAKLTDQTLANIPGRDKLVEEWTKLDKLRPASYNSFTFEGGRLFYRKRLGSESTYKLYYRDGWKGAEKLLFDPASYKPKVTTVVNSFAPSLDGKHVVLALTAEGAEWSELRVIDVSQRNLLVESIYPSYGPMSWEPDNVTFLYDGGTTTDTKSSEIELHRQVRVHKLGTNVSTDKDLLSDKSHPELGIVAREIPGAYLDEDNPDYVVASLGTVQSEQRILVASTADVKTGKATWRHVSELDDGLVRGFAIDRKQAYALTHVGAPRYKLVRTSLDKPDWKHAEVVVPEAKDVVEYFTRSKSYLFLVYSTGVVGRIAKLDLASGHTTDLALPTAGRAGITCPDSQSDHCLVFVTSWTQPSITYDLDGSTGAFTKSVFSTDVVYPGFDALVAEEVEVPSHDGVMVPVSIIHKKGMKMDGSASTILEGYGAYGISYEPSFSTFRSLALRGVVFAIAHVRGGGEKGEGWYKAGYKTTKSNTWLDFIAVAQYLVKHGYTSPAKLAGTGTSAGGILISRAITTRPDLFAAAVTNVGCANAMRMEFSPNGPVNTPEFGTVKDAKEAAALYEMDGVQHVQAATKYPAMMSVAGWNDPRVAPWEPGKFAAALQAASTSGKPVLLKVNYDNGHFTEDRDVTIKNFADQYTFMMWQTGHPDFQPR